MKYQPTVPLQRRSIETRLSWLGWTQANLAEVVGLSPSQLLRELRFTDPSLEVCRKVAVALDVPLDTLQASSTGNKFQLVRGHSLDHTRVPELTGPVSVVQAKARFPAWWEALQPRFQEEDQWKKES